MVGSGIYFTLRTGFIQVTHFKKGIRILLQKKKSETGISSLAAFFLSSAMRVGPGNILGVTGAITHKAADGRVYKAETDMPTHSEAFEAVVYAMTKSDAKVIDSLDEVTAIGHRVVHGAEEFNKSALFTLKTIYEDETMYVSCVVLCARVIFSPFLKKRLLHEVQKHHRIFLELHSKLTCHQQ